MQSSREIYLARLTHYLEGNNSVLDPFLCMSHPSLYPSVPQIPAATLMLHYSGLIKSSIQDEDNDHEGAGPKKKARVSRSKADKAEKEIKNVPTENPPVQANEFHLLYVTRIRETGIEVQLPHRLKGFLPFSLISVGEHSDWVLSVIRRHCAVHYGPLPFPVVPVGLSLRNGVVQLSALFKHTNIARQLQLRQESTLPCPESGIQQTQKEIEKLLLPPMHDWIMNETNMKHELELQSYLWDRQKWLCCDTGHGVVPTDKTSEEQKLSSTLAFSSPLREVSYLVGRVLPARIQSVLSKGVKFSLPGGITGIAFRPARGGKRGKSEKQGAQSQAPATEEIGNEVPIRILDFDLENSLVDVTMDLRWVKTAPRTEADYVSIRQMFESTANRVHNASAENDEFFRPCSPFQKTCFSAHVILNKSNYSIVAVHLTKSNDFKDNSSSTVRDAAENNAQSEVKYTLIAYIPRTTISNTNHRQNTRSASDTNSSLKVGTTIQVHFAHLWSPLFPFYVVNTMSNTQIGSSERIEHTITPFITPLPTSDAFLRLLQKPLPDEEILADPDLTYAQHALQQQNRMNLYNTNERLVIDERALPLPWKCTSAKQKKELYFYGLTRPKVNPFLLQSSTNEKSISEKSNSEKSISGKSISEKSISEPSISENSSKKSSNPLSRRARETLIQSVEAKHAQIQHNTPLSLSSLHALSSSEDFERALVTSPQNPELWEKFIHFASESGAPESGRRTAERALGVLDVRNERGRFLVWVSYLKLEHTYGTAESVESLLKRATSQCDAPLKVALRMAEIYEEAGDLHSAFSLFRQLLIDKTYKHVPEVWMRYGKHCVRAHRVDAVHALLKNVVLALPSKQEHCLVMLHVGLAWYGNGEELRGRALFERLLGEYPKKGDLWNVYVDQEMRGLRRSAPGGEKSEDLNESEKKKRKREKRAREKQGGEDDSLSFVHRITHIREIYLRMTSLSLPPRKMESCLSRFMEFEKQYGDEKSVEVVRNRALSYVEAKEREASV